MASPYPPISIGGPGGDYRYRPSNLDDVENVENYVEGVYHPVSIGDTLANGRYKLIHKLGFGGSSTVWLARDQQPDSTTPDAASLVALKVMAAHFSDRPPSAMQELLVPEKLHALFSESRHPVKDHIHRIHRHFTETGPNGTHLCLVAPFCGPSLLAVADNLSYRYHRRIEGRVARRLAKQAALVIERMHSAGMVHGGSCFDVSVRPILTQCLFRNFTDITTSNMLFRLKESVQAMSDDAICAQLGEPVTEEVITASGDPPGPDAPRELVESIQASRFIEFSLVHDSILVSDFGQSFLVDAMPEDYHPATTIHCTPPEVRFDQTISFASDVWMLACTLFEIRAGFSLFDSFLRSENLVWRQAVEMLGKLPDPWWNQWDARKVWFAESDGEPKPEEVQKEEGVLLVARKCTIRDKLELIGKKEEPPRGKDWPMTEPDETVMEEEEIKLLQDLLQKMLRYRPEERISMAEVIQHPWFNYKD
ncbi:CMGC/SRPK protein kinase [Coprinopsis cinerea okayama7|uniref:CMGC/SRPK protein kinase n=1 Tax=Coprinopsis cinerea (strain Okayama-7 / 130 / ATCC MYA-4618 / FGSC 9003) TaxID=240176 RepID=A8P1Q0_COPC7|nr:CMGC/SRPK protein kinase [Coprinopsis cinerea okayama7\|eukprot:XP_001838149.1 CMGC/SRPK protein kinase [Coprinopsis cinerea okayama7\